MIKILKEGKIPKKTKVIYKATCPFCSCEFEFEKKDCDYADKNFSFWTIHCPYCKSAIFGNNLLNLETREEKEEDE